MEINLRRMKKQDMVVKDLSPELQKEWIALEKIKVQSALTGSSLAETINTKTVARAIVTVIIGALLVGLTIPGVVKVFNNYQSNKAGFSFVEGNTIPKTEVNKALEYEYKKKVLNSGYIFLGDMIVKDPTYGGINKDNLAAQQKLVEMYLANKNKLTSESPNIP